MGKVTCSNRVTQLLFYKMFVMKARIIKYIRNTWAAAGFLFTCWLIYNYQAHNVESQLYRSDKDVRVEQTSDFIAFIPAKPYKKILIFYPGALVDPDAYIPLCRQIAENGIRTFIIKMPFRLAMKGYQIPKKLHMVDDSTKEYILAGHSQGAKMAAIFVYENPGVIDKLILLGSTNPRDIDLSTLSIPVLKIYGLNDGIAKPEDVEANMKFLPKHTQYIAIPGANHMQFGYYGYQLGDKKATISRNRQQDIVLKNMLNFIN